MILADGFVSEVVDVLLLQVIRVYCCISRPKLVNTHVHGDSVRASRAAISFQHDGTWRSDGASTTVFCESDPTYVNALDVAPWRSMVEGLQRFKAVVSDTELCVDLVDLVLARPLVGMFIPNAQQYILCMSSSAWDGYPSRGLSTMLRYMTSGSIAVGSSLSRSTSCVAFLRCRFEGEPTHKLRPAACLL